MSEAVNGSATTRGTIKKTPLEAFEKVRSSGIRAITLNEKDELAWVDVLTGRDDVILATGFRAALGPVVGLVTRDERGFARRQGRVASAEHPDLYFVGHHYDSTGGLHNIARDAPAAARYIARERA